MSDTCTTPTLGRALIVRLTPSTENLARWLHVRLAGALPGPARGGEGRVFESGGLGSAGPA